ncbi:MAG TPA: 3-isopropylmalate dehydratase small subunit [Caulobacteraceae bacterium]|nr:3-isopropylmalate dehydratase small subunit [Caulobacteraceae bacterium]
MRAFSRLDGRAAALPIANLDTDQIIPKQFLKTVEREGLGKGLFYDLRFDGEGREKPDFVLNQKPFAGVRILIGAENFGCGSSREHAAWALMDFGITCVIAPSFGDIFYENCFQNGVLPVALPEAAVRALSAEAKGGNHVFSVDLETQIVTAPSGATFHFEIDQGRKAKMLKGLDTIGETLERAGDIGVFEQRRKLAQPWLEARP